MAPTLELPHFFSCSGFAIFAAAKASYITAMVFRWLILSTAVHGQTEKN